MPRLLLVFWLILVGAVASCPPTAASTGNLGTVAAASDAPAISIDQLWRAPSDLATRDLFFGPGGQEQAPDYNDAFTFVSLKTSGVNPGYHVTDTKGRRWSVKLGGEAQSEVAVSRILWAIGFHQPVTYFLDAWSMSGQYGGPQPPGRFRLEPRDTNVVGDWSWYDNPFGGMQPLRGLVVAQVIFNNWDLKTVNNKVYEPLDGTTGRAYVVRDLGASLGYSRQFRLSKWLGWRVGQGTKNDLDGFERQGFIRWIEGQRVQFEYDGMDARLLGTVTVDDVRWLCEWLSKISDRQWDAAFRAGGYTEVYRERYVRKIKTKIEQGLALTGAPR
jgi:hypothetical protein